MPTWGTDILTPEKAAVFPLLLGKTRDGDFGPIANGILNHLAAQSSRFGASPFSADDVKIWIGALRDTLAEIQKRPAHAALAQNFKITVNPHSYIYIASVALATDDARPTVKHVSCTVPAEVPAALMASLPAMEEEDFLRVTGALESMVPGGWDAFDAAAVAALPNLTPKDSVTIIRAILRPRTGRPDVEPLLARVSPLALEKFAQAEFGSKGQWREAGVLAAAGLVSTPSSLTPAQQHGLSRIQSSPDPQLIDSIADALLEFGLSSKILAAGFASGLANPVVDAIVRKGRFDDLDPQAVIAFHKNRAPEATGDMIAPAAASDRFLRHVLEQTVVSSDQHPSTPLG